jgi:hypothetical protein
MLDLDKIAGERASTLSQERQAWLDAVWSEGFQTLSARLTDGEVIDLLALCTSAADLRGAIAELARAPGDGTVTPYDWLKDEASRAGLSPGDWVRRAGGAQR